MESFWKTTNGPDLAQGDFLLDCLVPDFPPDFGAAGVRAVITVFQANLVVVTQSCDLAQGKVQFVALCPVHTRQEWEETNDPKKTGKWEHVRKMRMKGQYPLPSLTDPKNDPGAFVVDFGQIISLPFEYVTRRAEEMGPRSRMNSPFLEHFSQAFGNYFSRVALPD